MIDKKVDTFLKGQLLGQLSACAMIGAVLFWMVRTGKLDNMVKAEDAAHVPAKVMPVAKPDTLRVIQADTLQRGR